MLLKLSRLKENSVFVSNIRWDVTPDILFQPRFAGQGNIDELMAQTQGFMFYIDYMKGDPKTPPALMVMKTYELRSKTIGEIVDVPEDMLRAAVGRSGVKDYNGMYPIDSALDAWLKKELGVTGGRA